MYVRKSQEALEKKKRNKQAWLTTLFVDILHGSKVLASVEERNPLLGVYVFQWSRSMRHTTHNSLTPYDQAQQDAPSHAP
ncbi:hypothetical protein A9Q99_22735 [Gammaproteobacteria bacterium 45_16_T64]|nr:hypothetical protein A9Q99_22735 [Gammaproteobacteria bacterium 45_16_T64]